MLARPLAVPLSVLLLGIPSRAQDPPPQRELAFETGTVTVKGDCAQIALPEGWSYLQQADARHVVENVWGNPPDPDTLGLVIPPGEADWAIIISYEDSGHVEDSDAAETDFGELLQSMQTDTREGNAAREKAGYGTIELRGWAEPPHYDSGAKTLYWAKHLRFSGSDSDTLNYDMRVLGRSGVLVMQAVAGIDQLREVSAGAKNVLAATSFTSGNRYADFDSSIDKVAAYGIGGLIAGKVLAKAGILKLLLKPILIGLAVVGGIGAKLFRRKKPETQAA